MNWEILWKLTLVLTFSTYSILVIVVFFGGIKDVKEMLKDLQKDEKSSD